MDGIGVERLGWTLIHFCWQGVLIAALYGIVRALLPRNPNLRYGLACSALALMMAAPTATWVATGSSETGIAAPDRTARVPGKVSAVAALPSAVEASVPAHSRSPWIEGAVAVWLLGVSLLSLRLFGGWIRAARLRRRFARSASPEWEIAIARLMGQIGLTRAVGLRVSAMIHVPTVIGAFRPLVLVPVGMLAGLPAGQVEALLLHELVHIRRHDYLVNLLQQVVEALLFYHPVVWWVSGHMRLEREHCCDDVAVSAGGSVLMYVNALAELESSRPVHLAAVAANGGSLADRIARLLGQPRPSDRNGLARGTILGAVLLMAVTYAAFAHRAQPAFQTASLQLNVEHPQAKVVRPLAQGRLMVRNAPLQMIIQNAYGVEPYQVIGGEPWVYSDGYDIDAKPERAVDKARTWLMLQTLLADRFKLAIHRETKTAPFFLLTAANGSYHPAAPKAGNCVDVSSGPPPIPGTFPCRNVGINMTPSGLVLSGRKAPMSQFVLMLAMVMGRPVINDTGFTGELDPELRFSSDSNTAGLPGSGKDTADPVGPNILAALQQQMGLKLTPSKGPVEVLVVDHAERPDSGK